MNKDRIEGAAKTVAGRMKETVGKMIGDQKLVAEGKVEKIAGKLQNAAGGLQDAAKEADETARKH